MRIIWILVLVVWAVVGHAETDWQLVKQKEGVSIYATQKPSYKLKHHQAQVIINHDADTILAALQDTAACDQWVYNCISNRMVAMTDFKKRVFHTRIHSPLWFKDRDFFIESSVVYDPDEKLFVINFVTKPEHAKVSKDHVRITEIEMNWRLQYEADNMTLVTYQVYIDPKLPIKAINHKMIQKSIFQTMLGLVQLVENPSYAENKYSDSELDMLVGED